LPLPLGSGSAVGVVGVGAMGLAMLRRLRSLGVAVIAHDLDPTREVLARAVGAGTATSPLQVASAGCSSLIVAVVDAGQTEAVLFGPKGAAAGLPAGAAVLLCPTLAPQETECIAARLLAMGLEVLDAPMSGGPARAEAGTMSLMLAGSPQTLQTQEPLLRALAAHRFVVGERIGDAARTKLVNNLLAAIHLAAAQEAMQLIAALGIDPARTLEVIAASSGASWIGLDRGRRALVGDRSVKARVALLAKDSALAATMAAPVGGLGPLGLAAVARFGDAVARGWTDADDSVLLSRDSWEAGVAVPTQPATEP